MTKKELVEALAAIPDNAEVFFDTEAARFNYHMATVDVCFQEEDPATGQPIVVLNTKGPRQH